MCVYFSYALQVCRSQLLSTVSAVLHFVLLWPRKRTKNLSHANRFFKCKEEHKFKQKQLFLVNAMCTPLFLYESSGQCFFDGIYKCCREILLRVKASIYRYSHWHLLRNSSTERQAFTHKLMEFQSSTLSFNVLL